ncbi:unnamed protein product [Auanema sp. JU1783]|nr:unnamed protein product [Auanema sp. JU1783]
MAFGGLLEGFLNEKNIDDHRPNRHELHHPRRSLTVNSVFAAQDDDKAVMKKLSYAGPPRPKYSLPAMMMMPSRESF